MSCSIHKFVLFAVGTVIIANENTAITWSQSSSPDTQQTIQVPKENVPGNFAATDRDDLTAKEIAAVAKRIGLDGRWIVMKVFNDTELTKAQIGQKPNDVISIVPGKNNRGPFVFG